MARTCSHDGCDGRVKGHGLCNKHYAIFRRSQQPTCERAGCDKRSGGARGLCPNHYAEFRNSRMPECSDSGCPRIATTRGLCANHYQRVLYAERRSRQTAIPCKQCSVLFKPGTNFSGLFCSQRCGMIARYDSLTGLSQEERHALQAANLRQSARERKAKRHLYGDFTGPMESELRRRARKCPLCSVLLTDNHGLPHSKELDHVVPICMGGTHTIGNVRIICRKCNGSRPKDGSDYAGPVTLWSAIDSVVPQHTPYHTFLKQSRDLAQKAYELRMAGMPQWREIAIQLGYKKGSTAANAARGHARRHGLDMPQASDDRARRAYELRLAGATWSAINRRLGYGNGDGSGGAFYAANAWAGDNGMPTPKGLVWEKAPNQRHRQAYEMRLNGHTGDSIAQALGYRSRSAANLAVRTWAEANQLPMPNRSTHKRTRP